LRRPGSLLVRTSGNAQFSDRKPSASHTYVQLAIVMITFTQPFNRVYSRTRRHLRCFPACNVTGHVRHSFCGQPITLAFSTESFAALPVCSFYAEFVPLDEPAPSERERIVGEVENDCIVFNRQSSPYVYDWMSSKHKAKMQHVFRVHVVLPNGQSVLSLDSAPFSVSAYLADLDDKAQEHSPLRIVLSAIRTHLPNSCNDGDWERVVEKVASDTPVSPGAWIGGESAADSEVSMDTHLMAQLVATEELHIILKGLCDFSLVRFRSWTDETAVIADVESFLQTTYELSLARLAQNLAESHVFNPDSELENDEFKNAYEDMARSAINGVRVAMGPQAMATFRPFFVHSFEGVFKFPKTYFEYIAAMHEARGWDSRVRHIFDGDDQTKFLVGLKIVCPTEFRLSFGNSLPPSSYTWLSLVPNQATRIGAFQLGMCSGPGDHVMFVYPRVSGLCLVLYYAPWQRKISVLSVIADGQKLDLHMLDQEYRAGEWTTLCQFRHDLVRDCEN